MRLQLLALACCASAALSSPAFATASAGGFTLEEGSFGTGLGVHSTQTQQGTTVNGFVNQDGSAVTFNSTDVLTITGSGQATIYPLSGLISDLTVNFAKSWEKVTFSLDGDDGTFTLLVNGTADFSSPGCTICLIADNGQNKFTLSGGAISSLAFTFVPGIDSARQFRVDEVSNVPAVPEPSTWALLLLGFGAVGFGLRRRKRDVRVRLNFA